MLDLIEPVVGRRVQLTHLGSFFRRDEDGRVIARPVNQSDVVGLRNWNPPKCADRLLDGGARLQDIAQHNGDSEAFADIWAATERERDRQPVLVHSVQQSPEHVAGAEYPAAPGVVSGRNHGFEEHRVVVVVAHQSRLFARQHYLGAADGKRGNTPHRQHPCGDGVVTAEPAQTLPHRDQFGEVSGERMATFP